MREEDEPHRHIGHMRGIIREEDEPYRHMRGKF
jgi:hypothetical protein